MTYTIGQILKLILSNYFCPKRTIEEIHQHSIDNNLQYGEQNHTCWSAKDFTVCGLYSDFDNIINLNKYLGEQRSIMVK